MIMAEKILLGVYHDQERLPRTLETIAKYNPSSIGLELPEDYELREKLTLSYPFFRDIISFVKPNDTKIIPLEDSDLSDYFGMVDLAKNIVEGAVDKEKVQKELNKLGKINFQYMAPEQSYWPLFLRNQARQALELVEDCSREEIISYWEQTNRDREAHMLKNIREHNPDMIIIGDRHAQQMTAVLLEYEYSVIK